ncbi:MAG: transglutaminase domain-containing protein, partial [Propionibacteriaceae bacterium]|nr:transglutaminase domain-containing protein [Propionibacteriaceae bacterium]
MARDARTRFGRIEVGGALFVAAMTALAAFAAWPVYASSAYLVLVGTCVGAAAVLAVLAHRLAWPGWLTTAAASGVAVVIGLVVAVPVYRVGALRGITWLFAGLVTAWKDLVTVELPVGEYRNLLVPALVVFLAGPLAALLLSWRRSRSFVAAAPVALAMQWFGLGFGADTTVVPARIGGFAVAAPREALLGGLGLLLCVGWLAWRARAERTEALHRAAQASGVRLTRVRGAAALRSAALAWVMVAAAVAVALLATPVVASGLDRDVLRSGTGPDLQLARAVDPLVAYRESFTDARFETVLFQVQSTGAVPDRVRLATLTHYDGVRFTVAGDDGSAFRRVPYRRDPGPGEAAGLSVTTGALGSLWLPFAGSLASIDFGGPRAQALGDGFYYDPGTGAAVDTVPGGLAVGDAYTARVALDEPADVAALASPALGPRYAVPESLQQWIRNQDQPVTGAGLAELAARLRARGYLSHALTASGETPAWVTALGPDYSFRPSTAGHSLARIDQLFTALTAREEVVAESGGQGSLVAAVGDDEQFSVAIALVADQLGFPARVVVGTRLDSDDDTGIPACTDGTCRGRNLSAWVEVQGADGRWAVVDATPQHTRDLAAETQRRRDPENPTQVLPVPAQEVDPPDSTGTRGDSDQPSPDSALNLAWLWTGLRLLAIALLALLVVLGPFLVVMVAKVFRRRARRGRADPVGRITGGWDELVDARIDRGAAVPTHETRGELALAWGGGAATVLAEGADRAVFS